jgi:hypothetical protein
MKVEFSQQIFRKKFHIWNFMKIRPVETELFPADGRTDGGTDGETVMTKLIVAFRNFANEPNNCSYALVLS